LGGGPTSVSYPACTLRTAWTIIPHTEERSAHT
jgi:hypothetical protein